jgi:FMNH2-dependent dimethyl sulfone monooxygenase
MAATLSDDPRSESNPLFNSNLLKLGVFAFNGNPPAMTKIADQYKPTWPNSLDVAEQADRAGYEAIVPYARWRAFVHPQHPSGYVFDSFTWAGAIAARTTYSAILSTAHAPAIHPLICAKAGATVDHVSSGRFGLNIVCGWFGPEFEMFGGEGILNHEDRYAYADEWITAVKRLWTDDDAFDFQGRFIRMKGAMSQPKPLQKPFPALMNAGGSNSGQKFVVKHCDMAFIPAYTDDDVVIKSQVDAYRKLAWENYHRPIQVWTVAYAVHRDSWEEANRFVEYYAETHGDDEYARDFMHEITRNAESLPAAIVQRVLRNFKAGYSGIGLLGPGEMIAERMVRLSRCGLDGVVLTWVDFQKGIRSFNAEVMPLLEQAGLRAPHRANI